MGRLDEARICFTIYIVLFQFANAIESLWQLKDEKIEQLDLFDERYVSALGDTEQNKGWPVYG